MAREGKLPFGQIFALATLGLVGSMALVGVINISRWAMSLPPEADLATLPPIVLMGFAKLCLLYTSPSPRD